MSDSSNVGSLGAGFFGSNTLTIRNGITVNSAGGGLGYQFGSTGTAAVDGAGSTWVNSSTIQVGCYGDGTLDITNGGALSNIEASDRLYIGTGGLVGSSVGSNGTVTVNGDGSAITGGEIDVGGGEHGRGVLNIINGADVTTDYAYIAANWAGSSGTATVDGDGSTWTNTGSTTFRVGYFGSGVLNITNGGSCQLQQGLLGLW